MSSMGVSRRGDRITPIGQLLNMAKRNLLSSHLKPNASTHGDFRPWKGKEIKKPRQKHPPVVLVLDESKDIREQCLVFYRDLESRHWSKRAIIQRLTDELLRLGKLDHHLKEK